MEVLMVYLSAGTKWDSGEAIHDGLEELASPLQRISFQGRLETRKGTAIAVPSGNGVNGKTLSLY